MISKRKETLSAIRENGRLLLLAFLVAAAVPLSCSLLVENRAEQCSSDADCSGIAGTHCDTASHICSSQTTTTSSGGSTGTGAGGTGGTTTGTAGGGGTTTTTPGCDAGDCWSCEPTNNDQFLNACTDAKCEKFDNKARCKHLSPDGTVPPLDASFD